MVQECIFCRTKQADRVYTQVLVEALILCIYKGFEEIWVDFLVSHRRTILIKVFTDEFAVSTINFRSLACLRIHNTRKIAW